MFFENLGKGLYTPAGYAGLIHYYIDHGHSPAVWKAIMASAANHAAMAAPMQAIAEISFGVLLVLGLLTRPVAFLAFLYLGSLWMSEWGTAWIWELLVPVLASLGLAIGRAGRSLGHRRLAGATLAVLPRGGDLSQLKCACPSSFPRIMKRRPSGAFSPIFPLILSLKSWLSTATQRTEHPRSPQGWERAFVHEPRRGYGRACLTGLAAASVPDVVVFLDGDYSDRPAELPLLLAPITEGRADITLGSRLGKQSIAGRCRGTPAFGNRLAAS